MRLKSIQFRFAFWAGVCFLVAGIFFVSFSVSAARKSAIENAQTQAVARAQVEANRVKTELEFALNVTRTLAQTMETAKESADMSLTREGVNAIIKKVLAATPQFVALYSDWEPNAFDGRDAAYGNKPGYNPDGRFNFTWSRGEDGEIRSDVTPPGDEEVSEWYMAPKRAMKEAIIEPYPYEVQGKEVLETTLSVPIIVKGQFLGMVGADLKIDFLQQLADEMNLYNRAGKLLLLSNKGVIAGATGQPELIKRPLQRAFPELARDLPKIKAGKEAAELSGANLKVLVPLQVGQTGTPWAAMILIPAEVITAEATWLMRKQITTGLLLLAVALTLLWYIAGKVARPIREASFFAEQIANGEPVVKMPVTTDDETGYLLIAMNNMLDNADTLLQTREERDRIERSITNLLEQVSAVAGGDLTLQAQVTQDATGAIADSFNLMIGELREIIGKVKAMTTEVSVSFSTTQQTTQQLATDAKSRAQELLKASQELETVADAVRRLAETTDASQAAAQQSLTAAQHGSQVLQTTVKGLNGLLTQIRGAGERIKRLNENAQGISESLEVIGQAAQRTSALAMNASIQAASVGAAGRGFTIIAREVDTLAARSTEAAKHIAELLKHGQAETQEAIASIEAGAQVVIAGTSLINEANLVLSEIDDVSAYLAQLIRSIAHDAQNRATDAEAVSQKMLGHSEATAQAATGIHQSARALIRLAALAQDLNDSVAAFKLPVEPANGPPPGHTRRRVNGHSEPKQQIPPYVLK